MRFVHVNSDAGMTGGATIAMLRLHRALKEVGHDSIIACRMAPHELGARQLRVTRRHGFYLFVQKAFFKLLSGTIPSSGFGKTGMAAFVNAMEPDAVVLHWIQADTISLDEIAQLSGPVFWYHHDLWPIRGITAHEWFKVPPRLGWLDRLVRWNKRRVARLMGARLIPVCASQWAADEIRKSGMYSLEPMIMPLSLDSCFSPGERHSSSRFRILNGARGGFAPGLKGGDRLLEALKLVPVEDRQRMEIVVFGESKTDEVHAGVPVKYIGTLTGDALAQQYRDADVFAFPSRQETFGQTKIEALACGTPVVAFNETACAEGIEHKKTGWIAPPDDIASYAEGLRFFFNVWAAGCPYRVSGASAMYAPKRVAVLWKREIERRLNV